MRFSVLLLVAFTLSCDGTKLRTLISIGESCASGGTCVAGGVCANGTCRTTCSDTDPCATTEICLSGACIPMVCGDGIIHGEEQCDDGNKMSSDGCSSACKVENEFACVGEPSECVPCTDADPLNCTLGFRYTDWVEWGDCSAACGMGTHERTRQCLRSDANFVDCAYCGGQCSESESCQAPMACPPAYSAWSSWSTCTDSMHTRTRTCVAAEGGATVDCAECGGECSQTHQCVTCGQTFNVAYCSPNVPGDQQECNLVLLGRHDLCVESGCTWNGPLMCTIGGSPSNSSCYGQVAECN